MQIGWLLADICILQSSESPAFERSGILSDVSRVLNVVLGVPRRVCHCCRQIAEGLLEDESDDRKGQSKRKEKKKVMWFSSVLHFGPRVRLCSNVQHWAIKWNSRELIDVPAALFGISRTHLHKKHSSPWRSGYSCHLDLLLWVPEHHASCIMSEPATTTRLMRMSRRADNVELDGT